jgi:hypothetical protein
MMSIRSTDGFRAFLFAFAAVLGLGSLPLLAQETTAAKPGDAAGSPPPATKGAYDPTRRVPPYFGQVGLTPEQKEGIYKIRARHQQKITDLQKQLAQAQTEMLAECETVLNDTQKKLLTYRREAAARARRAPAASAENTSPAKTADKPGN